MSLGSINATHGEQVRRSSGRFTITSTLLLERSRTSLNADIRNDDRLITCLWKKTEIRETNVARQSLKYSNTNDKSAYFFVVMRRRCRHAADSANTSNPSPHMLVNREASPFHLRFKILATNVRSSLRIFQKSSTESRTGCVLERRRTHRERRQGTADSPTVIATIRLSIHPSETLRQTPPSIPRLFPI